MPQNLLDKHNLLFTDSYADFSKKLKTALVIFGQFHSVNPGSSPEEKAWGIDVLRQPDTWFAKMRVSLLADTTIANANNVQDLSDAQIQGVIEAVAPGFITP